MKRTLHLSSLILLALGCARGTGEAPPAGGQSGDDGDAVPDPGPPVTPIPPGVPNSPCDPEETELAWNTATAFGGSGSELLAQLAPSADSPLFWVPFDSISGTRFSPGPGQASLALRLSARDAEAVKHSISRPTSQQWSCPDEELRLPVRVSLQSSDGAFDEQVDGLLVLSSGSTAHLSAELPPALSGSFAFQQIGAPGESWQSTGFSLDAELWPGGSHGEIYPSFATTSALATPPPLASPPASSGSSAPALPSHWRAVAVWPRRENCDGEWRGSAAAYLPSDRAIGVSLADVVSELNSQPAWTLQIAAQDPPEQTTPARFTLQAPVALTCVRVSGRSMAFDVQATLRADSAAGALQHLAATSVFELSATSTLDGSALERLHWVRRDVVQAQSRATFEAATGLTLAAPAEYQQLWWSWHGTDTRASASAPWARRGELVVSSLNGAQAAEVSRVVAQGGPGAGISFEQATQFPHLPGDALIQAESVPAEP